MRIQLLMVMTTLAVLAAGGCKKSKWIEGKWLLVTPEGKPGVCHEFKGGRKPELLIYTSAECTGTNDQLLSGRWQLKEENKLAILQGTEEEAHLVLITEKDEKHFVASGGISGKLFKVGEEGAKKLVAKLTESGEIKLHPLPPELGCRQLSLALKDIKALPTESEPRMIRQKDQGLEYHVDRATGNPKLEKIVYALNQDVIDWIAFHLTPVAFQPPGPEGWLEGVMGKAEGSAATGTGDKRQHIGMWRTYCTKLRGANNKDVDVTLFATTGQQRGTIYVSENVVAGIWEELRQTIKDSPPDEGDEEEGGGAKVAPAAPPPRAAPPPPPPAPKAPAKKAPAPAGGGDDEI